MKGREAMAFRYSLPLPRWVLHPFTAVAIAVVHVYMAIGHLLQLFAGDIQWTHVWKGFGALGGAYVFAALASRGLAATRGRKKEDQNGRNGVRTNPGHEPICGPPLRTALVPDPVSAPLKDPAS
jgi:hypothetical protein